MSGSRLAFVLLAVVLGAGFGEAGCVGSDSEPSASPSPSPSSDAGAPPSAKCSPLGRACVGREMRGCTADGNVGAASLALCESEALCVAGLPSGACPAPSCAPGEVTCEGAARRACKPDRTGFETLSTCEGALPACVDGRCVECMPDTKSCLGKVPRTCVNGSWSAGTPCAGFASNVCAYGACTDVRFARWKMPGSPTSAINPAKYRVNGAVVLDEVTGLEWIPGVAPAVSVAELIKSCEDLAVAGGGFHLASVVELLSLVDYSRTSGPLLDTTVFTDTAQTRLLSIETNGSVGRAVDFTTGRITRESLVGMTMPGKCVRPTRPLPTGPRNFVLLGADVRDDDTGLTWRREHLATMSNYGPGQTACINAGYRFPTVKELYTILDPAATNAPLIDTVLFPNARADATWSSTLAPGATTTRLVIDFNGATLTSAEMYIGANAESNAVAPRCVK